MLAKSQKNALRSVEDLKRDAAEVIDNISQLSRKLASAGKSKSEDFAKEVSVQLEDNLERLNDGLRKLNKEASKRARELDAHVHQHPWMYVVGGLGVGALLGKLLSPGTR